MTDTLWSRRPPNRTRRARPPRLLHPAALDPWDDVPPDGVLALIAAGLAQAVTGAELPLAPGRSRDFARLLVTPRYEAWLIAWAPAGALDLHDHGGSRGAVHVARGRLAETFIDPVAGGELTTRMLHAGTGVDVPADRVHEVWNPGPERTLSVHVYWPRLTSMTFFDRAPDGSLIPSGTRQGDLVSLEDDDR